MHPVEHPLEVDINQRAPCVRVRVGQLANRINDTCIANEHIKAAKTLQGLVHSGSHRRAVAYVTRNGDGIRANVGGKCGEGLSAACQQRNPGPLRGKCPRRCGPNSAACTRNHHGLICHIHASSLSHLSNLLICPYLKVQIS